jgi:hypothetical protein
MLLWYCSTDERGDTDDHCVVYELRPPTAADRTKVLQARPTAAVSFDEVR